MKKIPLSQNKFALVDDDDFKWLNQWKWSARKNYNTFYAQRRIKGKMTYMHQLIMNLPKKRQVDHIDKNGLNNQRINLRDASPTVNQLNRRVSKNNKSGYTGVHWIKRDLKWRATIKLNGIVRYLGSFSNKEDAVRVRNNAIQKIESFLREEVTTTK